MTWEQFEEAINNLPPKIKVRLFDLEVEAEIDEHGVQPNGYYLVLEAMSPEGYHVKFSIFDFDVVKLLNKNTP